MKMKKMFLNVRAVALGVGMLTATSLSSAAILPLSYSLSDSDIRVGETFDVDLSISFDALLEISSFVIEIDPLNLLPGGGVLSLKSWLVTPPLEMPFVSTPTLIEGYGDPFDPVMGGANVKIASLTFEAIGEGDALLSLVGLSQDWNGITFFDSGKNAFSDYDIDSDLIVRVASDTISSVPDASSTLGLLSVGLLAAVGLRRKVQTV